MAETCQGKQINQSTSVAERREAALELARPQTVYEDKTVYDRRHPVDDFERGSRRPFNLIGLFQSFPLVRGRDDSLSSLRIDARGRLAGKGFSVKGKRIM